MIAGAIDLHVHCAPDVRPRKATALELARSAQAAGMRGVLLKNHDTSTTPVAAMVREAMQGFEAFGGLVLNEAVGGLNPAAVDIALRCGARQIWMPTHCAAHERRFRGSARTGLSVLDDCGEIKPVVREIVALVAAAGVILGTGHLSQAEVAALIRCARETDVRKVLVNHPEIRFLDFPLTFQLSIAGPGVWFERCYMRENFAGDWDTLAASIRATGCARNVLATDLGQPENPHPVDGFDCMQRKLAARGFTPGELAMMCAESPAFLLNLI